MTCGENKKIRRRTLDASVVEGMVDVNPRKGGSGLYHSDNLCKVYDVRMMRQGMPIQYTYNSAPAHAVFMKSQEMESDATLAAVANTSSLIIHDVREDFSLAEIQPLQQHVPAEVRCVASSLSSQMIAVGDDAGGLHVWTNSEGKFFQFRLQCANNKSGVDCIGEN